MEFMHEIMEGIYSGIPQVDVSHITVIPAELFVMPFMNEVKERLKKHKHENDEDDK